MNETYDAKEEARKAAQQRVIEREAEEANPSPVVPKAVPVSAPVAAIAVPLVAVAAPTVAVPVAESPAEAMNRQLLNILIQQQARLAMKDQQEEEARKTRDKQREKNAQDHTAKDLLRQARCTHLKGGRKGPRSQVRDYAVGVHTFITGRPEIRCFICKMVWKMNDTAEFLLRHGKKVANHTKLGWFEATKMLEQTTNTPSSSEIPQQATPQAILAEQTD